MFPYFELSCPTYCITTWSSRVILWGLLFLITFGFNFKLTTDETWFDFYCRSLCLASQILIPSHFHWQHTVVSSLCWDLLIRRELAHMTFVTEVGELTLSWYGRIEQLWNIPLCIPTKNISVQERVPTVMDNKKISGNLFFVGLEKLESD